MLLAAGLFPPTWKQQSKEKKMSITIVPSSNAVVLGDNTTNPMTSNVGAFVLGWDGSDWDRVKVANGGRLQVDVLTSPAVVLSEPVSVDDNGGSLTVDDGGGSLTIDGTVAISGGSVDTELPAAVALADAAANPTVPGVGSFLMNWNGSTWDRVKGTSKGLYFQGRLPELAGTTHGPNRVNVTASGDTTLVAAPGAGNSIYVTGLMVNNFGTAKIRALVREGAAGTIRGGGALAADGGGHVLPFDPAWKLPANTALVANLSGTGDVDYTVVYYVATS